ncbi:MAG: NAD(+) kinase [Pseudazoarcus pumilus]|nr:NAD(+) kinase [Pseudazoarcus pumilus]
MKNAFRTVALVGKYQDPGVEDAIFELASFLTARGLSVWIEEGTAGSIVRLCPGCEAKDYAAIGRGCDLVVVLGGDGTMLHAARTLGHSAVPLVGVNRGRLGFLTDISRDEAVRHLGDILEGRYKEEQRFMLDAEVTRDGESMTRMSAFNDVVLNKGESGRLLEFNVSVDGEYVYTQRSDGMIVSTPTGSTAYSLSANGPILHPTVHCIALVPLAPHALTARPVTLPDTCRIDIELLGPYGGGIFFDGHERFDACPGDRLSIARAPGTIRLLHPESYSYFAMLREKLHWSAAPSMPTC